MVQTIIVIFFNIVIAVCLFIILKKGDNQEKTFQKIIGGFAVFVIAALSNNTFVFSLSLFIGGLIIASENFMILLAAIMKSSGGTIPDSIKAINNLIKKSTISEIEEKNKKSIEEIKETNKVAETLCEEVEREGISSEENFVINENDYNYILPKIERAALDKIENSLHQKIDREITFMSHDDNKNLITFDGSVVDNENKLLKLFEVKVFPNLPKNKNGKLMIFAIKDTIRKSLLILSDKLNYLLSDTINTGWKNILTMVIVLNTKQDFIRIKKEIERIKYEVNKKEYPFKINFVFYNLKNIDLDLE